MSGRSWFAVLWRCVFLWGLAMPGAWAGPTLAECHGMKNLVFVAHQDDDLLFMNPDIEQTITSGGCVETVYLTAAERGEGEKYMRGRARGVRAAYAVMANSGDNWTESVTEFGGKHQGRSVLESNPRVTLIYMRIRDPWLGKGWGSLTPLSRTESVVGTHAKILGPYKDTYTRAELVTTLAAIIAEYQPTLIRHMDDSISVPYTSLCWRCIGHDHPDHIASARLVRDAMKRSPGDYGEVAYVDYPTQERGSNLAAAEIAAKTAAFKRYARDDYQYCPEPAKCNEPLGTAAAWVRRTYYVVRHSESPALTTSTLGGYLLFTTGEENSAANVYSGRSQNWESLGGRTADSVAAFNWADGRAGVLALDATGQLWMKAQDKSTGWRKWRIATSTRGAHMPRVLYLQDGSPSFLMLGNDGALRYCFPAEQGSSTRASCTSLPSLTNMRPGAVAVLSADNRVKVFANDWAGRVWVTVQEQPGVSAWHDWKPLRPVRTADGGLAAVRNARGLVELFWRDARSGNMVRMVQASGPRLRHAWDVPQDLGFTYVGRPAAGLNERGHVVVAALERSGGSLRLYEEQSLTTVGANVKCAPALLVANGQLLLVSRSGEHAQTYWLWKRSEGAWQQPVLLSPPSQSGGTSYPLPTLEVPNVPGVPAASHLSASAAAAQP